MTGVIGGPDDLSHIASSTLASLTNLTALAMVSEEISERVCLILP
jgi:hypothetical protein